MVRTIIISTSGDFVMAERILQRIKKQLPAMTIRAMIKWGKILEKDMKSSLRNVSLRFRGVSERKGIRWEQGKRSHVGYLFMRREYLALDRMRPHWVSVRIRRMRLLAWAKQARIPNIKRRARMVETRKLKSFGVFVRPHPFISTGWKRARPKLRPILNKMAKRAIYS